jgi:hypothetical protein
VVSKDTVIYDKPFIELYSLEDFRISPDADWIDPINSSPYLITIRKVYVGDLKEDMKAGRYIQLSDDVIQLASGQDNDSVQKTRDDTHSSASPISTISDFNQVEVMEHIQNYKGEDVIYYTLGTVARLTDPVPLKEVYWHGKRPYVLGMSHIESHRIFSAGSPEIWSGLQEEINEVTNQKLNNVKLVLNKKFVVKSDAQVDLNALLRNQPGSVIYTEDPQNDVKELGTPDVTQSSYLEIERLTNAFNELAGNFNPQQGMVNKQADAGRTMQMLNSNMSVLVEFQLKTFVETFVSPILSLMVDVEREYETDLVVLELVGRQAGIIKNAPQAIGSPQAPGQAQPQPQGQPGAVGGAAPQQPQGAFGDNHPSGMQKSPPMTQEQLVYIMALLKRDLTVNANVGMNSTDPLLKLQKLIAAMNAMLNYISSPRSAAIDIEELAKEVFALSGYADGLRFLNRETNPQVAALQQQVAQMTQMLKLKTQEKQMEIQAKLKISKDTLDTKKLIEGAKIAHSDKELQSENARTVLEYSKDMHVHHNPQPKGE